VFTLDVPMDQATCPPEQYELGVIVKLASAKRTLIVATLPVVDGVVSDFRLKLSAAALSLETAIDEPALGRARAALSVRDDPRRQGRDRHAERHHLHDRWTRR
jgi:hypothetical protein